MGWAKYREDIVSRWVDENRPQGRSTRGSFPPEPTASVSNGATKKPTAKANRGPTSGKASTSKLKEFTASTPRPLPVIVLADTSGSMSENGKIQALNTALTDMVDSFAEEVEGRAEIHVAIITFGGTAKIHQDLAPASEIKVRPLSAAGMTPMGGALDLARRLVEDQKKIPGRSYTPAIVVVSDGQPNDEWEPALDQLLESERARKAQRFALGIGADADAVVLRRFLANPECKVYGAANARQIKSFFRWMTMSVATRSRSTSPNVSVVDDFLPSDLDELL